MNIRQVENRGAQATKEALIGALGAFEQKGLQSLTLDNGCEFTHHEKVKKALNIETYFCQPYL